MVWLTVSTPRLERASKMQMLSNQIIESVRNAFNFSVDPFALSGPDGLRTPFYGLFRSDNSKIVGNPVSKHYVPHQTEDVLNLVEAAAEAFDGVQEVKCFFREGHYVTIQPTKEQRREIFGTADAVYPRVIIRAGYDGKAFKASLGYYRDLCRNLAIMRSVHGTSVNIRHGVNLRPKMDELIATFGVLKQSWGKLGDVIAHLESKTVNIADFLKEVYGEPEADAAKSVTRHRNRTQAILERIYDERFRSGRPRIENAEVSAWEAFNAIQGFVQHSATRHNSGELGAYGRAVLAFNDPAVIRAEELAMAL